MPSSTGAAPPDSLTLVEAFAPAKVNLALHVTGRRADGYHLLDSIVVFAGLGDRLRLRPGPLSLAVSGPMGAGVPADGRNLVMQAARLIGVEARIELEKHLPAASGIGGGSSDAAAALRGLAALGGVAIPDALSLGADLPICLAAPAPARFRGIGEWIDPLPPLPPLWLVLVNPRVALSTPAVFAALERRDLPALEPLPEVGGLMGWLSRQRNDLEAPAIRIEPVIGRVLAAIGACPGCGLARMSGSGATCFGLFDDALAAAAAAAAIRAREPGWWVADAPVLTAAAPLLGRPVRASGPPS